jgi:hypothetical protein
MSYFFDEPEPLSGKHALHLVDPANHPVVAAVNLAAGWLMEFVSLSCWTALIVMFVVAELSPN